MRRTRKPDPIALLMRELGAVPIEVIMNGQTIWKKSVVRGCAYDSSPVESETQGKTGTAGHPIQGEISND